jgi:hypothetical protein
MKEKFLQLIQDITEKPVGILFMFLGILCYFALDRRVASVTFLTLFSFGLGILVGQEIDSK